MRLVRSLTCPPASGRFGVTALVAGCAEGECVAEGDFVDTDFFIVIPAKEVTPTIVIPNSHAQRAREGPYEARALPWT
jgi:hypothetical protein